MNCDDARTLLADYLGLELSAEDQAALEEHLAGCPGCAAEIEPFRQVQVALRRLPVPPPALVRSAARELRQPLLPGWRLWWRLPRVLAYAATLLIGAGIGWYARAGALPTARPGSPPAARSVGPVETADDLPPSPERLPERLTRNALALSSAFTLPGWR